MTIRLRAFNKWDRIFVLIAGAIGGAVAVATISTNRIVPLPSSVVLDDEGQIAVHD
jgi:hypothetical protein